MANDVLLEIKEDLQRDQMVQFFKKNGKLLVFLAILVVALIAASEVWKNYDKKQRTEQGDKLYATISNFNELKDTKKLREIGKNKAYKDVVTLIEANFHEAQLDADEMVKAYAKVANDPRANPALRELAELNLISIRLNGNPADAKAAEDLKTLTAPHKTYRFTAMEMLGGYYKKNGKDKEARDIYERLSKDKAAPASLAGRAKSMLSSF